VATSVAEAVETSSWPGLRVEAAPGRRHHVRKTRMTNDIMDNRNLTNGFLEGSACQITSMSVMIISYSLVENGKPGVEEQR
jgi:hypothetical protein